MWDLTYKVRKTIKRYSMLEGGERVLVALSGGPDSVCLTHILKELSEHYRLKLFTLYVDHGLRPEETPKEIRFCRELSENLGIPFRTERVEIEQFSQKQGLGIQDAARRLRYMAFERVSEELEADRIATGHNADDQAETFFMRILRGSGLHGLGGIPPVRGPYIRPLIETERATIEEFLYERGVPYLVDPTNIKPLYFRNKLRQELMPLLKRYNPSIVRSIVRLTQIVREENEHLNREALEYLRGAIQKAEKERIELFLSRLVEMENVHLRRVLRRVVEGLLGARGLGFEHIEDIIDLIKEGSIGGMVDLPGGLRATKGYRTLILSKEATKRLREYRLNLQGETPIEEANILLIATVSDRKEPIGDGRREATFDYDRLKLPLIVRGRREGDYFYPFGLGGRKKLQDFFVDEKVDRHLRDLVPLIVSGEDIIWVVGYRIDERYRVREDTKRVLRVVVKELRG